MKSLAALSDSLSAPVGDHTGLAQRVWLQDFMSGVIGGFQLLPSRLPASVLEDVLHIVANILTGKQFFWTCQKCSLMSIKLRPGQHTCPFNASYLT